MFLRCLHLAGVLSLVLSLASANEEMITSVPCPPVFIFFLSKMATQLFNQSRHNAFYGADLCSCVELVYPCRLPRGNTGSVHNRQYLNRKINYRYAKKQSRFAVTSGSPSINQCLV